MHLATSPSELPLSPLDYSEIDPPAALAAHVRCVWTLQGEAAGPEPGAASPAYPDGSPELIFNFGDSFEQTLPDGQVLPQPSAFLVGQITRPMLVRPTGLIDLVAVRFEAYGASLIQRPMRVLTDRWSSLEDLESPAARRLLRAHAEGQGRSAGETRITCLLSALAEMIGTPSPTDALVAEAVRTIRGSNGMARLDDIAERLGVTTRWLQRHFGDHVGITPKMLARIVRFQRVFTSVQFEPASLAQVALDCGYYDQSHLVRDFRDFAGDAPARALTQMPEFTAFFTARRASR